MYEYTCFGSLLSIGGLVEAAGSTPVTGILVLILLLLLMNNGVLFKLLYDVGL